VPLLFFILKKTYVINADEVVYQDLEDLKTACVEAAEGETDVKDCISAVVLMDRKLRAKC
jgi:hypothetical protein